MVRLPECPTEEEEETEAEPAVNELEKQLHRQSLRTQGVCRAFEHTDTEGQSVEYRQTLERQESKGMPSPWSNPT